jgi:hypothetical protein
MSIDCILQKWLSFHKNNYFITQILPENVKILTWILHGFAWISQYGGGSFQTIYSINNHGGSEHSRPLLDQNFEKFRAPPSVHRKLSEPPLMPENILVPPPPP